MFWVESSDHTPSCPICGGNLRYRDSRRRIRRKEGGSRDFIMIRRLRCSLCNKLHTELPDFLVPFKHYESDVISGVIDGIVRPEDLDSEDYPCLETMRRWLHWFQMNLANIEGSLRRAVADAFAFDSLQLSDSGSLLESIRKNYNQWLEKVLRIIYNSGGRVLSFRF